MTCFDLRLGHVVMNNVFFLLLISFSYLTLFCFVLFFSKRKSNSLYPPTRAAFEDLKKIGVDLIGIGISDNADTDKLKSITTGAQRAEKPDETRVIVPNAGEDIQQDAIKVALEDKMAEGI